jgi:hypothetical protein
MACQVEGLVQITRYEDTAMAKLIMSLDNAVIREMALEKERVTIGRKAHNDIQIDNLAVSGEHALIVTILNDSFLEDLGSTNERSSMAIQSRSIFSKITTSWKSANTSSST